eukprot:9492235-Heterocapsa_arctica.AAC.1
MILSLYYYYLATSLPRYLATSLPRHLATWLPGCLAAWLPGCLQLLRKAVFAGVIESCKSGGT